MSAFRFGTSKYKAKPADGFASKLEKAVYVMLRDRETLKMISDLKRQQTVVLLDNSDKSKRITWKIDFSYINKETCLVEYLEAKGFKTNDYLLKLKLYRANPPAPLEIWGGSWRRPKFIERIEAFENNFPQRAP